MVSHIRFDFRPSEIEKKIMIVLFYVGPAGIIRMTFTLSKVKFRFGKLQKGDKSSKNGRNARRKL